ncbi:MAG: sulfatase-like hydrolase/transferase, partial [Ginsengibacter sp.]
MLRNALIAAVLLLSVLHIQAQKKPNIVILFVDDLGWADLGYRNPVFNTPNIDQLKKDGMDFTRAYISTPT